MLHHLHAEERGQAMSIRYVSRALTAALVTCGVVMVAPTSGRAQQPTILERAQQTILPDEKGTPVTVVGCFLHRPDRHHHTYVLVNPTIGPATSVENSNCGFTGNEQISELRGQMLELREVHEKHMDDAMLGHVIEVNGKLGRVRDGDDLRKLRVQSFREVPVTPRAAVVMPPAPPTYVAPEAPPIVSQPAPQAAPAPVATTGIKPKRLPHTASPLPLIALIGLFAFTGALVLRQFDRRRALGRG
jgi:hypothetical protein